MDFFDTLMFLLTPTGLVVAFALIYPFYACLRVVWDVWRALTTFE